VKIKRLLMLVGIWCMVLMLAIPLVTSCAAPEPEKAVLKVAAVGALSGECADWGIPIQEGLYYWRDDINAKGGITVGGKTYMIEAISYDDKADTSVMLDCFNKLIYEENVKYILPLFIGSNAYAALPIVDDNNVIIMTAGCGFDDVLGPEHPTWFRNFTNPHERSPAILKWVSENHPGVTRWIDIVSDDEYGVAVEETSAKVGPGYGFEILPTEYVEWGVVDITPIMSRVVAQNPDMILLANIDLGTQPLMIKAARELGYTGLMGTDCSGIVDDVFVPAAGGAENVEGFFAMSLTAYGEGAKFVKPEYAAFQERYTEDHGFFSDWAADNYMCLQILEQAIIRADSVDTLKVAAELEGGKDYDTLIGIDYFGGEAFYGRAGQLMPPLPFAEFQDGHLVTIDLVVLEDLP